MPILFNTLLEAAGLAPADVRLLRHGRQVGERPLIEQWILQPELFDRYQGLQALEREVPLTAPY